MPPGTRPQRRLSSSFSLTTHYSGPQLGPEETALDKERDYDLDNIGGEPLAQSGFEDEEPDQTQESTLEDRDTEFGGEAA